MQNDARLYLLYARACAHAKDQRAERGAAAERGVRAFCHLYVQLSRCLSRSAAAVRVATLQRRARERLDERASGGGGGGGAEQKSARSGRIGGERANESVVFAFKARFLRAHRPPPFFSCFFLPCSQHSLAEKLRVNAATRRAAAAAAAAAAAIATAAAVAVAVAAAAAVVAAAVAAAAIAMF